jgi:hypothetical protein
MKTAMLAEIALSARNFSFSTLGGSFEDFNEC